MEPQEMQQVDALGQIAKSTMDLLLEARAEIERLQALHWRPIASFDRPDREEVDLWMHIYASPRSFGMADSFRVIEAWRRDGKWFHRHDGKEAELYADYVTHWMPMPQSPDSP